MEYSRMTTVKLRLTSFFFVYAGAFGALCAEGFGMYEKGTRHCKLLLDEDFKFLAYRL